MLCMCGVLRRPGSIQVFVTQLGLFFFPLQAHLIITHYDANLFFQNWKNTNGDWMRAYILTMFEEFWDDTTRLPGVCGIFFFRSALTVGKKNLSTNKKEKKKRPDERNTRIIMPRKRNMGFFLICKTLSSKVIFKKGGLHNQNITIVYIYERNKLLLLIY